MGRVLTVVPFFDEEIEIVPHSASKAEYLDRPVTIREFAAGRPCSLMRDDDSGELYAKIHGIPGLEFMQGPENDDRLKLIHKAREIYCNTCFPADDIDIEDDAKMTHEESGSYVQAWVWVPHDEEQTNDQ